MIKQHYLISWILLMFVCITSLNAQTGELHGKVVDEDGIPLIGANVFIKGTTTGTITNIDGDYSLANVPSGEQTIVSSFIGYSNSEKLITIVEGQKLVLNFTLISDIQQLDELVVVGYGTVKKSLLTGTISKVEPEEITRGVVLDAVSSLQGKAAGVVVQSSSGQPGEALSLNIRGVSTSGNTQPLYIVDGIPVDDLSFLNPSDIKSMEVLKDAAAASIYGARGGNGVVIITTADGKGASELKVSYDAYFGIQNPWRKGQALDAYDYALVSNEAYRNDGNLNVPFPDANSGMSGTNWWDEVVNKNAPVTNHNIAITGGNEHSSFSSSLSYFSQEGTFAPDRSNYERITARLNARHEYKWLTFGNNLGYTHSNQFGFNPNDPYDRGAMITAAMNYDPTAPIYDESGKFFHSPWRTNEYSNPVATLSLINNETIIDRVLANAYADIKLPLDGLNFKTSASIDAQFLRGNYFFPEFYFDAAMSNPSPSINNQRNTSMQWQLENTLLYTKAIGDHDISLLAGQSALERNYDYVGATANELMSNTMENAYINTTLNRESTRAYGGLQPYRLASYFGRLSYNFREKYLFSAVIRADKSTRFGTNFKTGYFPSVSAGWVLSKEEFFPVSTPINFAKIRGSWGQNGNDRIQSFAYIPLLGINTYTLGADQENQSGMSPLALANPDLKWEAIEQTNIGFDLGMYNNKLNLVADYYTKTTKDILITPDVVSHAGTAPAPYNGGVVKNSGIELELTFKEKRGALNYNVGFTYAYNKNEMTSIDNANKQILGAEAAYFMPSVTIAMEGEAINSFYGLQTDGVFQNWNEVNAHKHDGELIQPNAQPGDLRFVDVNDDGQISTEDRTIIGNPFPKHTLGLNLSVDWKGFDLNAFIYSALDYQIFNAVHRTDFVNQNWLTSVEDRWMGEGTSNDHPRVTVDDPNGNYSQASSFMVNDADMLRLKKLSIGYTLPASITDQIGITKARVYVSADNLLTLTKYDGLDPEIGSSSRASTDPRESMRVGIDNGVYPQSKAFIFGVNVTF